MRPSIIVKKMKKKLIIGPSMSLKRNLIIPGMMLMLNTKKEIIEISEIMKEKKKHHLSMKGRAVIINRPVSSVLRKSEEKIGSGLALAAAYQCT
jgi:hypothetical protein